MTCIVGLISDGKVYMGADSAGVSGSHIRIRADSKVFILDNFIIGFTTSFRMGQLLRYDFILPEHAEGRDLYEYMVVLFINKVRQSLSGGGFAKKENGVETGGVFLVGYAGRLFEVDSDYQVGEYSALYTAIGSGESYALGSLHTTEKVPSVLSGIITPEDRIRNALEAAAAFNTNVREPFIIKSI